MALIVKGEQKVISQEDMTRRNRFEKKFKMQKDIVNSWVVLKQTKLRL
jgi:hypothetical protein